MSRKFKYFAAAFLVVLIFAIISTATRRTPASLICDSGFRIDRIDAEDVWVSEGVIVWDDPEGRHSRKMLSGEICTESLRDGQ